MKKTSENPPRLFLRFFRWFCHPELAKYIEGDLIELYHERKYTSGKGKADAKFIIDVLLLFRPGIIRPAQGNENLIHYAMLQSYFKIGWRNLLRSKSYSFINITGLAAGICSCLLIVLYINDELSYDRYHKKADRIHRLVTGDWAKMPAAFAPALMTSYPHLAEQVVRFWPLFSPAKVRRDDVVFVESGGVFADANVFSVFSWPMIAGNPVNALTAANSIVLSQSMAKKYFGTQDPIGGHLEFWGNDMTVTGVISDIPLNSHLRFDFLISFPTLSKVMGNDLDQNWGLPTFYTYVLAQAGITTSDIEAAAKQLYGTHNVDAPSPPILQPITRIHLHSHLEGEYGQGGNVAYLYTLGTAAIFVMLLACINFTNLTTARAATRTKEVGIRKVLGALRRQLIGQFFSEALLMSIAALIIAITLVSLIMPAFNHLAGKAIHLGDIADPTIALGLLTAVLLIGLVAGGYPALFLSRFRPISVLKGSGNLRLSNLLIRKGLIVFQFMISTMFSIGMVVVLLQLNYLQNKDLGFDKKQVLVLDGDRFPQIRDAMQGVAGVEHVAGVPRVLGGSLPDSHYRADGISTDSMSQMSYFGVTQGFVETMGMRVVAGRSFIEGSAVDEQEAFILNESAIRKLGWNSPDDAIGKSFAMQVPPINGGAEVWRNGKVIGVVQDFNYDALYKQIGPIALYPSYDLNLTFVRIQQVNSEVLTAIKNVWNNVNPDAPFNYYLLDDHLKHQYDAELKLGNIIGAATALAILIACLGLFGLVAFSAGQRTKEIGIRKVFGASISQIVALLSGDFIKLVGFASILAIPLAYIAMSRWLDNFAYHIELSWFIFLGAGSFALFIAVLTVSYQSIKAAKTDPAISMRYE